MDLGSIDRKTNTVQLRLYSLSCNSPSDEHDGHSNVLGKHSRTTFCARELLVAGQSRACYRMGIWLKQHGARDQVDAEKEDEDPELVIQIISWNGRCATNAFERASLHGPRTQHEQEDETMASTVGNLNVNLDGGLGQMQRFLRVAYLDLADEATTKSRADMFRAVPHLKTYFTDHELRSLREALRLGNAAFPLSCRMFNGMKLSFLLSLDTGIL